MQQPPNFIFLGLSGSGKGTQEEKLKAHLRPHYKMRIISTGELFRGLEEVETEAGRRVKEILKSGGLPPEEMAVMLWMHEMAFTVQEDEGVIFDGTPRRLQEAVQMDRFLEFVKRKAVTKVIHLAVNPEEVTRRLLDRKRKDDTAEAIRKRIEYYYDEVVSTVEYYKQQNRLIEINGEQAVEDVFRDLLVALNL